MNLVLKISILQKFLYQADFAKAVGVNETVLSRIVKGRREPTPEQKSKMARILEVPRDELFPNS
jgi:transcriptional regulator with XRE-family HTH domain